MPTDTMPALPEMHGYLGESTQYRLHGWTAEQMHAYGRQCVQAERERCAKLIEHLASEPDDNMHTFETLAAAIRNS